MSKFHISHSQIFTCQNFTGKLPTSTSSHKTSSWWASSPTARSSSAISRFSRMNCSHRFLNLFAGQVSRVIQEGEEIKEIIGTPDYVGQTSPPSSYLPSTLRWILERSKWQWSSNLPCTLLLSQTRSLHRSQSPEECSNPSQEFECHTFSLHTSVLSSFSSNWYFSSASKQFLCQNPYILLCKPLNYEKKWFDRQIFEIPISPAPEILAYEPISLAADIWSLGVLAYVLLTGFSPYGGDTDQVGDHGDDLAGDHGGDDLDDQCVKTRKPCATSLQPPSTFLQSFLRWTNLQMGWFVSFGIAVCYNLLVLYRGLVVQVSWDMFFVWLNFSRDIVIIAFGL